MSQAKVAQALNDLHYSYNKRKLQEAFKTLYRLMKKNPNNEFSSAMPLNQKLEYNKYEVSRVVGFNLEMTRVFFADPRIGRVFQELNSVLEFFEEHPGAKKYCGLLFQHDSVCKLVNPDNILNFVRRMPLTATNIILNNPQLLDCIDSFDLLEQIISLVPSASSKLIICKWNLIEDEEELRYIGQIAPQVMDALLTEKMLGGLVNEASRLAMLEKAKLHKGRYVESPEKKIEADIVLEVAKEAFARETTGHKLKHLSATSLILQKLKDNDPRNVATILCGNLDICSDIFKTVYGDDKIDNHVKARIQNALIHLLNIRLENNNIDAVLDMAHIHLGLPPLFEYQDERHFEQAEYYIQLAQRLVGKLHPDEQSPFLERIKKLDLRLKKQRRCYLRAHPQDIIKSSLDDLKRLGFYEEEDFSRHCRMLKDDPSGVGKKMVINEIVETRNYETLIRFALNSEKMAKVCADPRMAKYWEDILSHLNLTPDPLSVLGNSFADVMGAWLYCHYEKWSLAGETQRDEAQALLNRSIDFGSAMGLYKKHAPMLTQLKAKELSKEKKQELLDIADKLSSKYWTFGFVVAGIIYLFFATYGSKDTTESHNYMVKVLDCLNCGEHFEKHTESKRLNQNLGTTAKALQQNFGIEFNSWDEQRLSVKELMLENLKWLMGMDSSNNTRSTQFDCSHSVSPFQRKDDGTDPFLDLDVGQAELYCKKIEQNWELMCQRAQHVQSGLKNRKTSNFEPSVEHQQKVLWDSAVKSVDNEWSWPFKFRKSNTDTNVSPHRRLSFTSGNNKRLADSSEEGQNSTPLVLWGGGKF